MRSDSQGELYPVSTAPQISPSSSLPQANIVLGSDAWHARLGHPSPSILSLLKSHNSIHCTLLKTSTVCSSCQISKNKRLPFRDSYTRTFAPFDIVHSDIWTSPILSKTGYKYYLILIDNFTQFVWVYPLKYKSQTYDKFLQFSAYIKTQFNMKIKAFQCDNGREFDNNAFTDFANKNGLVFRFSCPHTSPQNGKSERMIRRINEIILVLLQHGSLPPQYWVDALHTATHLHNILPTSTLNFQTPTSVLYIKQPAYDHLRIFGCECYPNTSSTRPHKLAPRSLPCVFIGYPPNHRGYRCLDPVTGRVYISRHVTFNESSFPFSNLHTSLPNSYSFLDDSDEPVPPIVISNPPATQPIPPDPPVTPTAPSPQSSQPNTSAPSPPSLPTPRPTHKMTTRSMHGIFKPRALTTTTSPSPIPKSPHQAL